jgi:hypothetical protein
MFVVNYDSKFYDEHVRDYVGDFYVVDGEDTFIPSIVDLDNEPMYDFEAYGRNVESELSCLNRVSPGEGPGVPVATACPRESPVIPETARSELSTAGSASPTLVAVSSSEVKAETRLAEQVSILEKRLESVLEKLDFASTPAQSSAKADYWARLDLQKIPPPPILPKDVQKMVYTPPPGGLPPDLKKSSAKAKKKRQRSKKSQGASLSSGPPSADPQLRKPL